MDFKSSVVHRHESVFYLSWEHQMDADKEGFEVCNAKVINELPVVSLFYFIMLAMLVSVKNTNFVPLDRLLPFDRVKTLIRACWPCRDMSLRWLSKYLLEILPCRSMDPQGAAWISCRPVALNGLRSRLAQKLVGLSKAWGTVECLFCSLGRNLRLASGIYFVLDLISRKLDLAGAWIARWGRNDDRPWLTWRCAVKGKEILQSYHENLQSKGQWAWGVFSSCRTPLWRHLEGRNRWSWRSKCNRPSGLSTQPSAAAIAISRMRGSTGRCASWCTSWLKGKASLKSVWIQSAEV